MVKPCRGKQNSQRRNQNSQRRKKSSQEANQKSAKIYRWNFIR